MLLFGDFRFDPKGPLLTHGSQTLELSPKALQVLAVLIRNSGQVVRKDDLLSVVWPNTVVEEGNLSVHISSLRKAFAESGDTGRYIETVPKRGYRFTAPVREIFQPEAKLCRNAEGLIRLAAHYLQQNTPAACRNAVAIYRKCIQNNPQNGKAYAGLADSLLLQFVRGDLSCEEGVGRALAVLAQAKNIGVDCANLHLTRSRLHCVWDWQWERASDEAQHGIDMACDEQTRLLGITWAGIYSARLQDIQGGIRLLEEVRDELVLLPLVAFFSAEAHFLARNFERAAVVSGQALKIHPNTWYLHTMAGRALTNLGESSAALRHFRLAHLLCNESYASLAGIACVHARGGKHDRAAAVLKYSLSSLNQRQPSQILIATVLAALGHKHGALEAIELACAAREWQLEALKRDCQFDVLRTEPRFRAVKRRIGI